MSYSEYADEEVLQKEFSLGKGLLLKAISNIDDEYINQLKEQESVSENEINTCKVFFKMVKMLNDIKDTDGLDNWENIVKHFDDKLQDQLKEVPEQIEQRNYVKDEVVQLREEFKVKTESGDEGGIMHNIKEFLCEAFCLVEIVEELNDAMKHNTQMVSLNQFTNNL